MAKDFQKIADTILGQVMKKYIEGFDGYIPTLSRAYFAQALEAHSRGDKAGEKSATDDFISAARTDMPTLSPNGLRKLVASSAKKHARFTYAAAFKKRMADVKKLVTVAKKKPAEVERARSDLFESMKKLGDIPKGTSQKVFEAELVKIAGAEVMADDVPMAEAVDPGKINIGKAKWGPVLSTFKLDKYAMADCNQIATWIKKSGKKALTDQKVVKFAEECLKRNGSKRKPKDFVMSIYDAAMETAS